MDDTLARTRFRTGRNAVLGTVADGGQPHLVPCCYAMTPSADTVYSAIDGKPKSTMSLRRLANIESSPSVSFLVDHFHEDWSTLWWIRVDGDAKVIDSGDEWSTAIDLLVEKYSQYQTMRPAGPVIATTITSWRFWSAA